MRGMPQLQCIHSQPWTLSNTTILWILTCCAFEFLCALTVISITPVSHIFTLYVETLERNAWWPFALHPIFSTPEIDGSFILVMLTRSRHFFWKEITAERNQNQRLSWQQIDEDGVIGWIKIALDFQLYWCIILALEFIPTPGLNALLKFCGL